MKNVVLLLCCSFLVSCVNDSCSILTSYGLEQNQVESDVLKNAISISNSLLGEKKFVYRCITNPLNSQVVVFDTSSKNLSKSKVDMLFVLEEAPVIIFQESVYSEWIKSFSDNVNWFNDSDQEHETLELLEIDESYLLAFFLLHELGHINSGHPGRALGDSGEHYNTDETIEKVREKEADEFASNIVMESIKNKRDFDQSTNALWISNELGKVSFNLQGIRSIIHFGGTVLCLPYLFEDTGITHANFELRILKTNFDITGEQDSKDLFDFFLSKRLKTNCESY